MSQEKFSHEANQPRQEETEAFIKKRKENPSKERLDFYQSTFEVNGKRIENLGVYHDPVALKEYRKELEAAVGRASVVVLEGAPTASGIYSEAYIDYMLKITKSHGLDLSRDMVIDRLKNEETGFHFFRVVEEIAARAGKPIVVIDPAGTDYTNEESRTNRKRGRQTNDAIELTKLGMFLAGIAGIVGPEVVRTSSAEKEIQTQGEKSKKDITRRTFLKRMIQAIGVTALTPTIITFLNRGNRASGIARKAAYDYYDFRDVTSTKGLKMLAEKNLGTEPILLVYATPHSRAIEYYSSHPKLTETKYDLYKPLRDAEQPTLRLYRFENNSWRLAIKEEIK